MPAYSSTNQSSRVFAPYTVVTQDSSRLAVSITTADGLPASGITAGDVIRWDPTTSGYTLSYANSDTNSEVVGVVESKSDETCVVVLSGSIKYPTSRLSAITSGGGGGVDVLFLSDAVRGGLTGTVDITGGDKIVKPIMQIAPHGIYNGVVINYLGYKTGNQVSSTDQGSLLGPGSVMLGPVDVSPGINWLAATSDLTLSITTYPDLYNLYSATCSKIEQLNVTTGTITSGLVGKSIYQLNGSTQINVGTITAVDTLNLTIDVQKAAGVAVMDTTKNIYVQGSGTFVAGSTSFYKFIVPKITVINPPSQNGIDFIPYIKTYDATRVTIPEALTIDTLTVSGTLSVGGYTDTETTIDDIYSKLSALNAIVRAY